MSIKALAPLVVVPAPVASTAWVGYEVMQGDEKVTTDVTEIKNKNNEVNSEFNNINKTFTQIETKLKAAKEELTSFESSINQVEQLKKVLTSHIDEKLKTFKKDIKEEVEKQFKAIKFDKK